MACKKTKPCGCADQPIMTPPPCNELGPCAGEPCSEVFCEECIVHCQPDIFVEMEGDISFTVTQGMRWDEILQNLMIFHVSPECVGVSATALKFVSKTSTSITVSFIAVTDRQYTIHFMHGVAPNTATMTELIMNVSQYTAINLLPDTEYTVWITTDTPTCYSVKMLIKTNATT